MRFHSGVLFVSPDLDLPCFQCVVHVRMRKAKRHYRRGTVDKYCIISKIINKKRGLIQSLHRIYLVKN